MFFKRLTICFLVVIGCLVAGLAIADDASPDAIAIRVMPNLDNFSPLSWYAHNVTVKGAPQSLTVDGYEAVRDGRSVYINAANLVNAPMGNHLYTNIYIISYNQEAEQPTQDIFGQILKYWKFNTELVEQTGAGNCLPLGAVACDAAKGCGGEWADYSCEQNRCVKKCLLSSDCPTNQYCDSAKAKLARDVKRMSDLREMDTAFANYHLLNKKYPDLPSGSYLPNKTLSVWPSWNETLGSQLGYRLPLDPVNRLGAVPANFDTVTGWDENQKKFATALSGKPLLPEGSLIFFYEAANKLDQYKLCANFETSYEGLPAEHRCDDYIGSGNSTSPEIVLGGWRSKSGTAFKDYFLVNSQYPLDWSSLTLKPYPNWSDWAARGWQWSSGVIGLKVEKVPSSDQDIRSISANRVNLTAGGDYDLFSLTISINDIYGNIGSTTGDIRICNPATCQSRGAECGRASDNCGGTLLCGECSGDLDCVNNKCIKL